MSTTNKGCGLGGEALNDIIITAMDAQSESLLEEEELLPPRLRLLCLCFLWPWPCELPAYKPAIPAEDPAYDELWCEPWCEPWCESWCEPWLLCFLCFLCFFFSSFLESLLISSLAKYMFWRHVLVTQHVRTDRTGDHSTEGTKRSTTHLVAEERATSTSNKCRT
jgi:hypothetical protein